MNSWGSNLVFYSFFGGYRIEQFQGLKIVKTPLHEIDFFQIIFDAKGPKTLGFLIIGSNFFYCYLRSIWWLICNVSILWARLAPWQWPWPFCWLWPWPWYIIVTLGIGWVWYNHWRWQGLGLPHLKFTILQSNNSECEFIARLKINVCLWNTDYAPGGKSKKSYF